MLTVIPGFGMPLVATFFPDDAMKDAVKEVAKQLKKQGRHFFVKLMMTKK